MIVTGSGNLLTCDVSALVNTVNTVGVMGKGIALQFKRAFPANFAAYRRACAAGEVRLGHMFVFDSAVLGPRRYVINFPTKEHWRSRSRLADIESGLVDLVRVVRELRIDSLAVPPLGCGNGGLDWSDVWPMMERAFAGLPDVRVVVFPPAGTPDPRSMPVGTTRPDLTVGRAVLLLTIGRYLRNARGLEPREGISELEVQKLAYFLQQCGIPLRLAFTKGHYGPYAENLHPVLDRLEGHYLIGYGDRSAPVQDLPPIVLADGAEAAAARWLATHAPDTVRVIDRVIELAAGFETPYSLELLATVHYAASTTPAPTDVMALTERVRDWSGRKARLFTAPHVGTAHRRLAAVSLLS